MFYEKGRYVNAIETKRFQIKLRSNTHTYIIHIQADFTVMEQTERCDTGY